MSKFSERFALLLRILAISNLAVIPINIWITITYPVEGIESILERSTFYWIMPFFLIDFLVTLSVFYYVREEPPNQRRYKFLYIGYIVAGLLARLLVSGVVSGLVLDTTQFVTPMSVALSSIFFIALIYSIMKSKVGAGVTSLINLLIFVNLLAIFLLSGIPSLVIVIFLDFAIAQFAFAAGGIVKIISYLVASVVYFRWASQLKMYDIADTTDLTWPEKQQSSSLT